MCDMPKGLVSWKHSLSQHHSVVEERKEREGLIFFPFIVLYTMPLSRHLKKSPADKVRAVQQFKEQTNH